MHLHSAPPPQRIIVFLKACGSQAAPEELIFWFGSWSLGPLTVLISSKRRPLTSACYPLFALMLEGKWDFIPTFLALALLSFCCNRFFSIFNIIWVFDGSLCSLVLQLLEGPLLLKKPRLLWLNLLKAILSELWFERNQRIFHDKEKPSSEVLSAERNAAALVSLNKDFGAYYIQDICLNWAALLSQLDP